MIPGAQPPTAVLRRTIGPFQLTFYALGSMLGSGIYGLIGQVAGLAGNAVWLSFLVALFAAWASDWASACLRQFAILATRPGTLSVRLSR
jgi:amino acid transporter